MNEDEILKLVADYGFQGDIARQVTRLARDIERETRQRYFALMQRANNAAQAKELTVRDLDRITWDKSVAACAATAPDNTIKGTQRQGRIAIESDDEIQKLVSDYGFEGDDASHAFRLAREFASILRANAATPLDPGVPAVMSPLEACKFVPDPATCVASDDDVTVPAVDCGEGYRQLRWREPIEPGDEFFGGRDDDRRWLPITPNDIGRLYRPHTANCVYAPWSIIRRRELP